MPLPLEADTAETTDLDDLIRWLRTERIDTSDHQSLAAAAPWLRRLANNRDFLANLAVEELKKGYSDDRNVFIYSAQVMLLHLPTEQDDNFFIRANFWPSLKDQQVKAAGTGPFFYHRPHDHNFNFLTIGYHGSGYWSDYYEYDRSDIDGYPGEYVPSLTFTGRRQLSQNDILLYRASVDVHDQLPADEMSISLNIAESTPGARLVNQYAFDLEQMKIKQIINISLAPCVFGVTAMLGGDNGQDILHEIIRKSPDPFMRFSAHKALAGTFARPDAYCEVMSDALNDRSNMVSKWAERHISQIQAR